jgi:single-strand DNA-binding protein
LTKDPELRSTGSGVEVCSFTVAVDRRAGKDGEKKCDFIECTAWRKTGVFIDKYFKKGDGINVVGRMESEKFQDKDGNNRISWKVTVDDVEFHYGKKSGSGSIAPNSADPLDQFAPIEDGDGGDLPF